MGSANGYFHPWFCKILKMNKDALTITFTWQLWNNVRTAFRDQHDLVELAETLSQNFETLYEKEVFSFTPLFFP